MTVRDSEYEGLSDEEIEAIKDADDEENTDPGTGTDDDDTGDDDNDEGEGGEADDDDDDKEGIEGDPADAGEASSGVVADEDKAEGEGEGVGGDAGNAGKPDEVKTDAPAVTPAPDAGPSEAEFDAKIKALDTKLDDGEIDFDEYKKGLLAVERERTRTMVREEMRMAAAEQVWQSEQDAFFSENGYLKSNKHVYNAFATEVNTLLADPAMASKSGLEILRQAKASIDSAFGTGKPPSAEKEEKKPVDKGKQAVRDAKASNAKRTPPQTLKDVPASESNNEKDRFAYLDDLEGPAFEAAISKLTAEELEAYAKA